jgi:DNA-directed RNA polymerase specialized sigma24 family protein/tetratricopeptide (TPR) repeat protein
MHPTDDSPLSPTSSDIETSAAAVQRLAIALLGSQAEVDAVWDAAAKQPGEAPRGVSSVALGYALIRRALWARLDGRGPRAIEGEGVGDAASERDAPAAVRKWLDGLRPSEREVLILRFVGKLELSEIATICRVTAPEIEERLRRGLSRATGLVSGRAADCSRIAEQSWLLLQGGLSKPLAEHLSGCDACRDRKHDLARASDRVAHAADDAPPSPQSDEKLLALIRTAAQGPEPATAGERLDVAAVKAPPARAKPRTFALLGLLGVAAVLGGIALAASRTEVGALSPGGARVERLSSTGGGDGLRACAPTGSPCRKLARGDRIPTGSRVESDATTRADIELNDGVRVLIDRNTEFVLAGDGKAAIELVHGVVVADVQQGEELGLKVRHGGGKLGPGTFNLRSAGDDAVIEVTRGGADLFGSSGAATSAGPGESVRLGENGARVTSSPNASDSLRFDEAEEREGAGVPARGLGELRARKPGAENELKGAVRLTSHAVRVRIAGALARTEIEEVFSNGSDETLEGIYRFPLPPNAQIERLALEVDGKLIEGAFVDRDRAAAIWRGAIVNSNKNAPRPREEIVWVPGPWKDPALLEWQRGGRFELRIFPIPKRGSRRIVLAYTEALAPSGDVRRYTYPLAHDPSATTRVDRFSIDVRVRGHDPKRGVQSFGYESSRVNGKEVAELAFERQNFVPSGDLVLEYGLGDPNAELRAWAYAGATSPPSMATPTPAALDGAPYATIAIQPEFARRGDGTRRAFAVVVDSSRSMFGESYSRAKKLAGRLARELDAEDRLVMLSCDSECRTAPEGLEMPGRDAESRALAFLDAIEADGASDPSRAIEAAYRALSSRGQRSARIVYIGDATPTMGPIRATDVERAISRVLAGADAQLTAVGVGVESDPEILSAMARGGGGVAISYAPGATLTDSARGVLAAAYGQALRDVEVELPAGLYAASPVRLDAIPAGGEAILGARMSSREVSGDVVLRGRVHGAPFERRYPIRHVASASDGNSFVPRQYAALRIRDLERQNDAEAKRQALLLSSAFNVASRYSSLLVLESQAMFRAFGLDNERRAPVWSGEESAEGESVDKEEFARAADVDDLPFPPLPARAAGSSAKSATSEAKRKPWPEAALPQAAAPPADEVLQMEPRRRYVAMRRLWERVGEIDAGQRVPSYASPEAITRAEREAMADENRREATRKLYTLLAVAGEIERAEQVVARWSQRDPLDPEALTARADLAARRGDRERAIRLLGSVIDVRPDDVRAQRRLERLHRWAGRAALGCRHLLAAAGLRGDDPVLLADAVRCARNSGETELAERLLASAAGPARRSAEAGANQLAPPDFELGGDLRLEASWSSGVDLDLSLLDPDGNRLSWLGAPGKAVISARDATSTGAEGLALRGAKPGQYVIEVVRPAAGPAVSGTLTVTAAGTVRRIPFTLDSTRAPLAVVNLKMRSRLVPLNDAFPLGG